MLCLAAADWWAAGVGNEAVNARPSTHGLAPPVTRDFLDFLHEEATGRGGNAMPDMDCFATASHLLHAHSPATSITGCTTSCPVMLINCATRLARNQGIKLSPLDTNNDSACAYSSGLDRNCPASLPRVWTTRRIAGTTPPGTLKDSSSGKGV